MVSWKSLILAAWALLWGYIALRLGLAIALGSNQICSGVQSGGRFVETCRNDYPSFTTMLPLLILLVLALGCLYFATRSLLRARDGDRLRLQSLITERSRLEVRKALRIRRRRIGGSHR